MNVFTFDRKTDEDVIVVNAIIEGKYEFRLALDTAATHTTIDSNILYLSGLELKDSKGEKEIETSNGIIIVEIYEIEALECLGINKTNLAVQVYDFLSYGILSDYDGVIGLDFLQHDKICIDLTNSKIIVN